MAGHVLADNRRKRGWWRCLIIASGRGPRTKSIGCNELTRRNIAQGIIGDRAGVEGRTIDLLRCPCPRIISSHCGPECAPSSRALTSMKSSPVVDGDHLENVPSLTSPTRRHEGSCVGWSMFGLDGLETGTDRNSAWSLLCALVLIVPANPFACIFFFSLLPSCPPTYPSLMAI